MSCVDLIFALRGNEIPRDHGYFLYSAVSRIVPEVHEAGGIGIFPIRGASTGNGTLMLNDRSHLRIRLAAEKIPNLLPLAGKPLDLDGRRLRLGVPHIAALVPAAALSSPLVLIKLAHANGPNKITPEGFLAAAAKKLAAMEIKAEPGLQLIRTGARAGEPRRRVLRVKEQTHVGYAMVVQGLTAEESILLQEQGLGGRKLMGCGLFLPFGGAR